jgi:hypothetical protein
VSQYSAIQFDHNDISPPTGTAAADTATSVVVLEELADRICAGHLAVQRLTANALAVALEVGDLLIEARNRISTGWEHWLDENCLIGASSARLYMQLARARDEIEMVREQVPDLSLRAARRLIAKPPKLIKEPAKALVDPMSAPVPDPIGVWDSLLPDQRERLLDHIGRAGLAAYMSPALNGDLIDHLAGLAISKVPSKATNLEVSLTNALRLALSSEAEALNALAVIRSKLRANGRSLNDVVIALGTYEKKQRRRKISHRFQAVA